MYKDPNDMAHEEHNLENSATNSVDQINTHRERWGARVQQQFCFVLFFFFYHRTSRTEYVCNVYEMNSWHTREKISFANRNNFQKFFIFEHTFPFYQIPLFLLLLPPLPLPAPRSPRSMTIVSQIHPRNTHTVVSSILNGMETFWWLRCFSNCLWSGRFFIIYNSNTIFVFIEMILCRFAFFFSISWFSLELRLRTTTITYAIYRRNCRVMSLFLSHNFDVFLWMNFGFILVLLFVLSNRFSKNKSRQIA